MFLNFSIVLRHSDVETITTPSSKANSEEMQTGLTSPLACKSNVLSPMCDQEMKTDHDISDDDEKYNEVINSMLRIVRENEVRCLCQ